MGRLLAIAWAALFAFTLATHASPGGPCWVGSVAALCIPVPEYGAKNTGGVVVLGPTPATSFFLDRKSPGFPGDPIPNERLGSVFASSPTSNHYVIGSRNKVFFGTLEPRGGKVLHEDPGEPLEGEGGFQQLSIAATVAAWLGDTPQVVFGTSSGGIEHFRLLYKTYVREKTFRLPRTAGGGPSPPALAMAVGHLNSDNHYDLLVGVPGWTLNGRKNAGVAYEYWAGTNGLPTTPSRTILKPGTPQDGDRFGALAALINWDNIGPDNPVIAAPGAFGTTGGVFFRRNDGTFFGQTLGLGNLPGTFFGSAIIQLDLDSDGVFDIAIGAPGYDHPGSEDAGALYFYGGGSPTPVYRGAVTPGNSFGQANLAFGAWGHGLGNKVLTGAPCKDVGLRKAGAGVLVLTNPNGIGQPFSLDTAGIPGVASARDYVASDPAAYPAWERFLDLCAAGK